PDTQKGTGDAAHRHTPGKPVVDRPLSMMLEGTGNLGDRGVGQVGADGDRRPDANDEDEQRSHERAPAHSCEADEEANQQTSKRKACVHWRTLALTDPRPQPAVRRARPRWG